MTKRGFILFAILAVAWGIPYLLIKVAVGELEPAMVVFGRSILGACCCCQSRCIASRCSSC